MAKEPAKSRISKSLSRLVEPIAGLKFDPANARKHGKQNLDSIKSSLLAFGQQKAIVADADGVVLAGNGTLAAAKELGWTEIAVARSELRGEEARAFAIADNRTAELAEWDKVELAKAMIALPVGLAIGWDEKERERVLAALATPTVPVSFTARKEPETKSEVFVEIYCSRADYETVKDVLASLSARTGVVLNVSL